MAKQSLATIKSWFKRGAKPTAAQFASVFDSFFHKDESIPQSNISELGTTITALETLIGKNKQITIQQEYDGLTTKDSETVYFCADTGNLYLGQVTLFEPDAFTSATLGNDGIVTFTRHGNGASTTFTLDMNPLLVQPDWNQNDSEERDYVKNRTHWEEKENVVSIATAGETQIDFEWPFVPEAGEKYVLTCIVNENEYEYTGIAEAVSFEIRIVFGSGIGAVFYSTQDTFSGMHGRWLGNPQIESLIVKKVDIHTLPEKYIPESIARKSELAPVAQSGDYDDLTNKPSIPDAATMIATHNTAQDAHNDIRQMALGAMRGQSYADIETMVTALNALPADSFRVGDNIYLDQLNVPDVWISAVNGSSTAYTYVDDSTFTAALSAGRVQVGYFSISQLETEDVVLNPATTSENGLMSAADKQKLESMVHNATRVQITGFKESGGNVIGSIYIWNTPRQGGYYSSPDVNLQIRIPMIMVNGYTVGFNEDYNFDITGPIESLIHSIIGDRIDPQITTLHNRITDEATARNDADNAIYTEIVMPPASTSTALSAGVFADFGTLTENKMLTLPTIEAGKVPEFNGQFTVDANGDYSVTFPNGVTMVGETTQEAGVTYQFSICNGYGVIVKMA